MIYKATFPKISRPYHLLLGFFPKCKAGDDGVAGMR